MKLLMNDKEYDRLLQVQTTGLREIQCQPVHYNRYEATPYFALDVLIGEYEIDRTDGVVDFGCGKGRLLFYLHHRFQVSATGIEVNASLYQEALENLADYMRKNKRRDGALTIECCPAEEYKIKKTQNRFYFFNPFSVEIFMKVVYNILHSVEVTTRSVDIILYYPSTEYIHFLENQTPFEFYKEVKVSELYNKNENEWFLIYRYEHN